MVRHFLADIVEPKSNPELSAVVTAIARGEIECRTEHEAMSANTSGSDGSSEIPTRVLGELNTPFVEVKSTRRKRRRRNRGVRVPVLAGEVARLAQQRHGRLSRTPENVLLVAEDIARRVESLKKMKDERFVHMRGNELVSITRWATEMFWIEPTADEDIREYLQTSNSRSTGEVDHVRLHS